jgi:hypothetical protein
MTVQGQAADFNGATNLSPAQIRINNALLVMPTSGHQHISIKLVAKDDKNLHEGQIYQAYFSRTTTTDKYDGSYDEGDEIIYIQELLQASSLSHQTTLKCVNKAALEFAIIEINTSVIQPNPFFDPSLVHKTNYLPLDN